LHRISVKFQPHFLAPAFKVLDHPLPVFLVVIILTGINVFVSILEHVVDHPGDFVSRGRGSFGGTMFGPHAAIEAAEGAMALAGTLGRERGVSL
jgi:hypothetical protein